jgi:hypothetical protein
MATARVPAAATTYVLDINTSFVPNIQGLEIGPTDSVEFTNLSGAPIQIIFMTPSGYNPVFNNTSRIDNGRTSSPALQPLMSQVTTDYWVLNLNNAQAYGPYSIEVTTNPQVAAPLAVPISGGYPPSNPDMSTVAVPQGGWVQLHLDGSYNVTFTPSNSFTGPANPVSGNPIYHANTGNQNLTASYSLASVGGVVGGGSVKIHS